MKTDIEAERLRIERERLHVERVKAALLAELVRAERVRLRRTSRSWMDRVEDAIFDW